jgi:lipopolysaccharide export system permease protein
VFVLIGAPVGVRSRRGGFGFAMGVSTLVFVFYYMFLTGGEDFADRRLLPPWLSMWLANIVFLAIGLALLRAMTRESGWRWRPRWWPGGRRETLEAPEAGLEHRSQRVGVGI